MDVETRLRVRVSPGASRTQLLGRHGDAWKLQVAAPPEGGRANDAVVRLLAAALDRPMRDVALVSGHGSRDKTVSVAGIGPDETQRRLARACGGGKDGQ
jgi:uncharacterized protein (TIGR00251 family)